MSKAISHLYIVAKHPNGQISVFKVYLDERRMASDGVSLINYIRGSQPGDWDSENTKVYSDKESALSAASKLSKG